MENNTIRNFKNVEVTMNPYQILNDKDFIFFTTQTFALKMQLEMSAASHQLKRMAQKKMIAHVKRNLWANVQHPYFTPLGAVPFLMGKEQGYVSFLTALNLYSLISQIPQVYQMATTGHTKKMQTPIGYFEFHKLKPEMMQAGIEWSPSKCPYRIACAEKALLDTLYISVRKKKKFHVLPELHFSKSNFSKKKFLALLGSMKNRTLKKAIHQKFKTIFILHPPLIRF